MDTNYRRAIGPSERLAICLRYLATGDSFRTIANSYRVGHSTVCGIVAEVARAIWDCLVGAYMPVPTSDDWRAIAVVDAKYCFRVVDVGGYGRTSNGGTLAHSTFDEAFPLCRNLMRPFPGTSLSPRNRVFNYRLSRARLIVENTFGILSAQWRMYRRVIAMGPENVEACVKATCVLHNYIRRNTRTRREPVPGSEEDVLVLQGLRRVGSKNAAREAIRVRETYTDYFSAEGAVAWQPRFF
ncbi:hypothetical protein ABVT39_000170 [Epinephelus coioides]